MDVCYEAARRYLLRMEAVGTADEQVMDALKRKDTSRAVLPAALKERRKA